MEKPKLLTRGQVEHLKVSAFAIRGDLNKRAAATIEALAADLKIALAYMPLESGDIHPREQEIRDRWKSTGFLGEQP